MRLYDFLSSGNGYKVRLLLQQLAIPFERVEMDILTGDGAFGINAMEIDSAKRHGAKVVFIVSNNAAWNIERLDQEMNYGGRVVGTTLAWSDYAAMARAFGGYGERVTNPEDIIPAIKRGIAKTKEGIPVLLEFITSKETEVSRPGT
jgi:acetolactate synthase-1/2/3 large subunit